jgi:hypothetical protein
MPDACESQPAAARDTILTARPHRATWSCAAGGIFGNGRDDAPVFDMSPLLDEFM